MTQENLNSIINCLELRLKWYQKAIAMSNKTIPYENGFNFPSGNIDTWQGATSELKNTLDMLNANKYKI